MIVNNILDIVKYPHNSYRLFVGSVKYC